MVVLRSPLGVNHLGLSDGDGPCLIEDDIGDLTQLLQSDSILDQETIARGLTHSYGDGGRGR